MAYVATQFNRGGSKGGSGRISTQRYVDKRTPEERDTDDALQFYGFGTLISVVALVCISLIDVEDEKDENGKVIIDPTTKLVKKKYTTKGIILTVLFSLLLVAVLAVFIYRNFIMKPTASPTIATAV
jgi:hypothetical protein